ncbi:GCN5-related N-acetyltransferase [Haladaptatus paucihalophilus DX253]|uniref:Acetyltransferase (GNAT) family protein n=1 Tax=Haladaptatus paucihalophilus DX253 TaxID=797209 RepID=E7QQS4_HALPU|nr:GNAT family N-acetyltransferase [Haladaptatus paucihalophilus]EFW93338.1 GCN5-related N-acetyltransferase [Haladaptatus paucihalophilus DX253]SHK51804.1 Acetyltransferase (GNAT) family protein [Haladaptatus paucihalophilus DX253]
MEIRPYETSDADEFWELKRAFELGLGAGTGGDDKAEVYEGKLTEEYRERYLDWVERCVGDDERCVTVADAGDGLAGYVFVLPEELAFIWDAAVLNEIYVRPAHRGTGVADELMDAAVSLAADQTLPLDRLVLDVDRENDRAGAFYERHGFEHWGEMVAKKL